MAQYKVVILDTTYRSYDEEKRVLETIDADIVVTRGEDHKRLVAQVSDSDAIIVNLNPIDAGLIGRLTRCRVISRYGVGYDNVDVEAATRAGIHVTNVADYATEDVSDHAVALLMACVRKIPFRDARIRDGSWNLKELQRSYRTAGKVMGILGLGNIGRAVARKLSGLSFSKLIACDPYITAAEFAAAGALQVDFDTLLRESDFLSIHVPLNDETRHMIDAEALGKMKESAVVVNTARGGVIDTEAIAAALESGKIACAGLDVHETEPLDGSSPLMRLDNVILTDHCAWYTEESLVELKTRAAENVVAVLRDGDTRAAVNTPR